MMVLEGVLECHLRPNQCFILRGFGRVTKLRKALGTEEARFQAVDCGLSFWLSSLSLPEEVLERVVKPEGHLVPSELDALLTMLGGQRTVVASRHEALRHGFESYESFCSALGLDPNDSRFSNSVEVLSPRNLVGLVESGSDVLKGIPVTYGEIYKLRCLERTLRDIDGLVELLSRIRGRFLAVEKRKDDSVRLFISSSGKGLNFRLVYEPPGGVQRRRWRDGDGKKGVRAREGAGTSFDVQRWIEFGQKAILEKATENGTEV